MASSSRKSALKMSSCCIFLSSLLFFSSISSGGCREYIQFPTISSHPSTRVDLRLDLGNEGSHLVHVWSKDNKQGDCSRFIGNIPRCCKKTPTVVDLPRGTPYNMQIANCCKGGVLKSWYKDPGNAVSAFQVTVGAAGTTNRTIHVPKNFTFKAPGSGYTCGRTIIVKSTRFVTPDGRRVTQALMTWRVLCNHFKFSDQKIPKGCVSLSSFNNDAIVNCPT